MKKQPKALVLDIENKQMPGQAENAEKVKKYDISRDIDFFIVQNILHFYDFFLSLRWVQFCFLLWRGFIDLVIFIKQMFLELKQNMYI